jgi:hypothetical protein
MKPHCNTRYGTLSLPFYLLFFCFFILSPDKSHAQNTVFKSPTSGILGSNGAMEKSPWAFFTNPAGLSELPKAVAGIGYQNDFHLKELSASSAFMSFPIGTTLFSGGFTYSGFQHFNTQQYSAGLSRKMAPWLNMGVRFNYHHRHQSNSQNARLITLDAGWQIAPSEKIHLGFYTLNPARSPWHLEDGKEEHPTFMATSVAYRPVSGLQLEGGLAKEMAFPPTFSLMVSSQVHPSICLRGTAASAPLRFGLGSGIEWQNISFDMGVAHHETLGFSSAFGLLYQLSNPTKP